MEDGTFPTVDLQSGNILNQTVRDIFSLTAQTIKTMTKNDLDSFLRAYAQQYALPTTDEWYEKTSLFEKREQLLQAAVELHSFNSPRTTNNNTTDDDIQKLEPILVYKDLFQIALTENNDCDIQAILNKKFDVALDELATHVHTMETTENQSPPTCPINHTKKPIQTPLIGMLI